MNRRLGVQRRMSLAESLWQSKDFESVVCIYRKSLTGVAKGVEHMQERNYERGQIARNALQRRSDAFWTRVRAAQRRDAAARRNVLEGIRSRFDQMRNLFANVQERQDSQAQENKAALSSWVNGALFFS